MHVSYIVTHFLGSSKRAHFTKSSSNRNFKSLPNFLASYKTPFINFVFFQSISQDRILVSTLGYIPLAYVLSLMNFARTFFFGFAANFVESIFVKPLLEPFSKSCSHGGSVLYRIRSSTLVERKSGTRIESHLPNKK